MKGSALDERQSPVISNQSNKEEDKGKVSEMSSLPSGLASPYDDTLNSPTLQ